jgi:integrase
MGAIRRAPGDRVGWQARYRDPNGTQRTRTFPSKADARAWLSTVETDVLRGEWIDPAGGKVTFGDYATHWLTTKAGVAPRTLINIEGRLRNHLLPAFREVPLGRIQPSDIRGLVAGLTSAGRAPGTVKAVYLIAAQVFEQAVVDGMIPRSPCRGIELPRERHSDEMHFLTPEQVNDLASAIDERYRALIYTAAYGGLRAGELTALKGPRLNPLARTLEVVESMAEVQGRLELGPTKTGRRRTIALPRFLAELLGEHVGCYPSPDGFVFTSAEGGPIRHRNFSRRHFRPAVSRAGLPEQLRFHDLRHTCAALLIADGQHMEAVKDHLGHSSIRVTSDRYGHLFPSAREALAAGLDDTFKRAAPSEIVGSRGTGVVQALPQ